VRKKAKKSIGNLSSLAKSAYNKIKKIQEKTNITKQDEAGQIQKILSALDSNTMQELYTKIPSLTKYYSNNYQQQPYQNQYPGVYQQQWNGR